MDYKSKITGIGPMALDFLAENMIIVFNDNAPEELAELAVLHEACQMDQEIKVGDVVMIGTHDYVVAAVGEEANHTFRTMGHCTFKFTGNSEVELPGHVNLDGETLPEIKIGDQIEILFT